MTATATSPDRTDGRARRGPGFGRAGRRSPLLYPALGWVAAGGFAALVAAIFVAVAIQSSQAWRHSGLAFLWSGTWSPEAGHWGSGLLVVGTVVTTGAGMVLAVPLGIGTAIYLAELAPAWLAAPLSAAIDFLAAVPSIVVGLWALLVLSPVFAHHVEPILSHIPGIDWAFHGPAYGPSILLAAVVLAVMVLPTVVALSRNALVGVERADREAALALGATRWQVARRAVLPAARRGIAAGITLAVGRALGESIAVAMVIGNRPGLPHSLLEPGATIGSAIVNQFGEASPGLATSSIVALAAVLLALTVAVNAVGVAMLSGGETGPPPPGPRLGATTPADAASTAGHPGPGEGRSRSATPAGIAERRRHLGRRRAASRLMGSLCGICALIAALPLIALVYYTVERGHSTLSWSFLTHTPKPAGIPGGGISTAISGSARIVGLALVMAVPVGLLAALFLYERRGSFAAGVRFGADVLTGVPSIVIGIFAYAVLVVPLHRASTGAAAFALAVLMLPIMIRGNEEALRSVPSDLWEAGVALGVPRSKVARRIIVREALGRLVTANLLATARGVGETAPLLFTVAAPSAVMTFFIFDQGTQPFPAAQQTAWATALTLLASVLALSVLARAAAWRLTRHQR